MKSTELTYKKKLKGIRRYVLHCVHCTMYMCMYVVVCVCTNTLKIVCDTARVFGVLK